MAETMLVTGAAGFVGSHLTDRLLHAGHVVIGVDNLALGRQAFLTTALQNARFHFIHADLNQHEVCLAKLRAALAGSTLDMVWHLAANSDIPRGVADPSIDLQHTFMTTFNTLKLMQALHATKLLFASTSAIYGERRELLHEDSGPLFPISNYGAMKLASEGLITAALESALRQVWIFRFPNVVGSRASHGALYDFFRKLATSSAELEVLGDGSQEKPYLHVSELLDAMLLAAEKSQHKLNYFNIGQDGSTSTVRFLAETVVQHVAPGARIRYTGGTKGWVGDVPFFRFSIEKIKALGWRPRLTSDASIELAVRELAKGTR
jgi:UDP-glucose 4-epimerase